MNTGNSLFERKSIEHLILHLSMPSVVALLVSALYNIIDTIFVGNGVGLDAVGGLAVAFPIQIIITALSLMIGNGGAAIVSSAIGNQDFKKIHQTVGNMFWLCIGIGIIASGIIFLFLEEILFFFGATEQIIDYSKEYIHVILLGNMFVFFNNCGNDLLRAQGKAKMAMIALVIGTGINCILDPLLINTVGMGVKGAAVGTIISQLISAIIMYIYMLRGHTYIKIKWRYFRMKFDLQKEIILIGLSTFAGQASASIVTVILNNIIEKYGGNMGISIYGSISKIAMILILPLFGIAQGVQPVISYNYGANNHQHIVKAVKVSLKIIARLSVIASIGVLLMSKQIVGLINKDGTFIYESVNALRIVILSVPLLGIPIIAAASFQAIGRMHQAIIAALSIQIIFLIPLAIYLPKVNALGMTGVWIAFPVSALLAAVTIGSMLFIEMKQLKGKY